MNHPTLEDNLKVIKDTGFEGVEMIVPNNSVVRSRLVALLNENGLDLVAQVRAEGATADMQIASLEKGIGDAAGLNPLFVNAHCGKDFLPFRGFVRGYQGRAQRFTERPAIHFVVNPSFKASISRPISSASGALGFSFRYVR